MAAATIGQIIIGGLVGASTAYSISQSQKADYRQRKAIDEQRAAADSYNAEQARQAEEMKKQMTESQRQSEVLAEKRMDDMQQRGVPKQAGSERVLSQAEQAAQAGPSSTMLTGPMGVDPTQLQLGKSTLLGG